MATLKTCLKLALIFESPSKRFLDAYMSYGFKPSIFSRGFDMKFMETKVFF